MLLYNINSTNIKYQFFRKNQYNNGKTNITGKKDMLKQIPIILFFNADGFRLITIPSKI